MAIPRNEETLLPILTLLSDKKPRSNNEINAHIEKVFKLTPAERVRRFATSKKIIYQNHVRWGLLILRNAGLIESKNRESNAITVQGLTFLSKKLKLPDLLRLVKQATDSTKVQSKSGVLLEAKDILDESPEDLLDKAYKKNKESVKEELLALVRSKNKDSSFLENLVVDLVKKMGYYDAIVTGRTGDGGIDGIVYVDPLRTDFFPFQAKNWAADNPVRSPDVQKFAGGSRSFPLSKGLFITTSKYTPDAEKFVKENKLNIILIDGDKLAENMFKYNLGVSSTAAYEVKSIDRDYFEE